MENVLEKYFRLFRFFAIILITVNSKEITHRELKITTDTHSILSPWISSVGCFNGVNTSNYISVSLTGNDIVECLFHCNTTYIGLQVNTCVCFGGNEINQDKSWNRVTTCKKCGSSNYHACGSNTSVSVYTKINSKSPTPDDFSQRCGFVNCTDTNCNYYQGLCINKYQGICVSKALTNKATWNESVQFCRNSGSDLLGLHRFQFSSYNLTYGTNYWLNIFRTDVFPEVDKKDVHSTTSINPSSEAVNIFTHGYTENKTVDWNNTNTNVSSTSATNKTDTKHSGTVLAIVIVCLLLAVGLVIAIVFITIRRRRRSLIKRPSRIAIVPPMISKSSNSSVDQEHFETVSSLEQSSNLSEAKMSKTNENNDENSSRDKGVTNQTLPQTYYKMDSLKELEQSENYDYIYKVPVYQTDQYVAMRNSENGEETTNTTDDKDLKSSDDSHNNKEQQTSRTEIDTAIILTNENINNEESDFEPEYYPMMYMDKNNQENGNALVNEQNESENDTGDDFEPDYYPVVMNINETNDISDNQQSYVGNSLYCTKVIGGASDVISQTVVVNRGAVSGESDSGDQEHLESVYDYPKSRVYPVEGSATSQQPDNKDDIFKTYDMADNGGAIGFEDSIYEPIEVNNQ